MMLCVCVCVHACVTWEYYLPLFKIYCKHCGKIYMEVRYGRMNAGENSEMACILRFCEDQLKWHHVGEAGFKFPPTTCVLRITLWASRANMCRKSRQRFFFTLATRRTPCAICGENELAEWQNSLISRVEFSSAWARSGHRVLFGLRRVKRLSCGMHRDIRYADIVALSHKAYPVCLREKWENYERRDVMNNERKKYTCRIVMSFFLSFGYQNSWSIF